MDSTRLALDYQWVPVESEPGIPYSFGSIDGEITAHMKREHNCPAVYRWNIQAGDHTVYYVGETDLLTRRLRNYLRGHKSQPTASRLNKELQERTEKGQKAILEVLSFTPFSIGLCFIGSSPFLIFLLKLVTYVVGAKSPRMNSELPGSSILVRFVIAFTTTS